MSKFIVGDIHGCYLTLLALIAKLPPEAKGNIVFVGDLVDRGPDSRSVIQYAIDNNVPTVSGNHEQMMFDYYTQNEYEDGCWLRNGGEQTLDSYVMLNGEFNVFAFNRHCKWIAELPIYLEFPEEKDGRKLVVSHSAVNDHWKFRNDPTERNQSFKHYVQWNRDEHVDNKDIFNVHGHTPAEVATVTDYYANVDTGCVFNRGLHTKMTCLQFPEMKIFTQDNIDVGN